MFLPNRNTEEDLKDKKIKTKYVGLVINSWLTFRKKAPLYSFFENFYHITQTVTI